MASSQIETLPEIGEFDINFRAFKLVD
jgi:hypothetical protein